LNLSIKKKNTFKEKENKSTVKAFFAAQDTAAGKASASSVNFNKAFHSRSVSHVRVTAELGH